MAEERRAYSVWELPEDILEAILRAEMPPGHEHLDELMQDEEAPEPSLVARGKPE